MKGLTASPFSPPPIRSFVEHFRFHIAETCVGHNQSKAIVRNDLFSGLDSEALGGFFMILYRIWNSGRSIIWVSMFIV